MNALQPRVKLFLRLVLLTAGLGIFGWFFHRAGPAEIWRTISRLNGWAPLMLLPLGAVYSMETWGWRLAFGTRRPDAVSFPTLWRIRLCGEAVNNVIPSGTVGGEAVKVYLLHKRGVQSGDATAATIVGRTIQTLMQVTFIALGSTALFHLAGRQPGVRPVMVVVLVLSVGLVVTMFYLQTHGMFALVLQLTDRLPLRWAASSALRGKLRRIDAQVLRFYGQDRRHFLLSASAYLSAWLLDTLDIWLAGWLLGMPIDWLHALGIESSIGVIRLLGFLVPGSIGVQETGITLVCGLAGLPQEFGPAYAVIRRARDVFYAAAGWVLLYFEEATFRTLRARIEVDTPPEP